MGSRQLEAFLAKKKQESKRKVAEAVSHDLTDTDDILKKTLYFGFNKKDFERRCRLVFV